MSNAQKTHCKHGHEFTPENTYLSKARGPTMRQCRQCRKDRRRTGPNPHRHEAVLPDAKALARLLDAYRDGVDVSDLMVRFGATFDALKRWLRLAQDNEGQGVTR